MMQTTARLRLWVFGMLTLVPASALAQDTASLTGTVRDKTGAVLSQAAVVIKNTANGLTRNLATNSDGEYLAAALPAGHYNISVMAKGFSKYRAEDVTLRVAQKARIDVTLQIGDVNSEVTVQGEGLAQVNTQSSELSGTITGKEIAQLQLNGRNFTQLITLVPGVSNQTGQDEGVVGKAGNVHYSVNGGRTENNNWEVDGGDIMDNGSNATLNVYPSIEAIDEVEVLTSNYGAQYGKNASGTIEVETKSGTNRFHGSAYEFWRNEAFNAHNYFDFPGTPKAGYKKHDFGYSVGGPIWKNHTFFFWSEEWRRENVPQNFINSVPSLENRQGNFNDVCNVPNPTDCPVDANGNQFPNNQLPFIDPNGQALLPMIPEPTIGAGVNSLFAASISQPTHWREELVRIDHDINSRLRASFRYIHDSWDTTNATVTGFGENFPTIRTHFIGPGVSIVAKLTATISPALLNEFVAGYSTDHIKLINTDPQVWQRPSTVSMTGLFPNSGGKLPDFCMSTNGAYGGGFCEGPAYFPFQNSNPTYTFRDNVSKKIGKHNLEFGGYAAAAQKNELAQTDVEGDLSFDTSSPVSTGNAFADLLMGNIANYSQDSAQPKYYVRYKLLEPYIQDDYHIAKNLTLNLGLRLSLFGTFFEIKKQVYNWEGAAYDRSKAPGVDDANGSVTGQPGALILTPGTSPFDGIVQCGAPGVPRGCVKGHLFNPAPRVGFAWDPRGNGKMSIRAGYGIFFDHTNGEEGNAETLEGTPPLVENSVQYNVVGYTAIGGQGSPLFPLSATSIPDQAHWPYVQQWHLDVQRDLIKNAVATISYVGSKGTHLTLQREFNQLPTLPASVNPFQPGQPITNDICNTWPGPPAPLAFTVNGNTVTGQAAENLSVACGNDPNPFRPYYSLGNIQRVEQVASSNYNALQFSLRKTSGALTLGVAYTYSHSLDDSSDKADGNFVDSTNIRKNHASSNFDQRHILTASWVYELPFFRTSGFSHSVVSGWQFAGIMTSQSGTPFSVTNGVFGDSAGVANGFGTGSYADRVGDPHRITGNRFSSDPTIKGPLLFDPNAYVQTQGLTFGNSGRNSLNNPYRTNFDLSVYKMFKPTEKLDVQFRAEGFNVFNHTQWNGINSSIGPTNFMYPSGAHAPRVLQFALKVVF